MSSSSQPAVSTDLSHFCYDRIPIIARVAAAKKQISWQYAFFGMIYSRLLDEPNWHASIRELAREFGTSRSQIHKIIRNLEVRGLLVKTGNGLRATCPTQLQHELITDTGERRPRPGHALRFARIDDKASSRLAREST